MNRLWMRITIGLFVGFFFLLPLPVQAWKNHTLMTWAVFQGWDGLQETVTAEPLEVFLAREKDKIGTLLQSEEEWAKTHIHAYPPRPPELDFITSQEKDLRLRFLRALRLNPEMKLPLYVMLLPGLSAEEGKTISRSEVSVLSKDFEQRVYVKLSAGEKVKALEVLATASDEPDNGLDIGLWEDNGTEFGRAYRYGKQPFGNPKLDYGTQAPFHMGFYHESGIVGKAAPSFLKTFPEQRVHLFQALARLAFQTGHPYWGYRFAGWGLHYLQDITMPYHATIMPGRSTLTMISIALLDMIGIHGPKDSAVSEVSRAHIFIEKLLNQELHEAYRKNDQEAALFRALRDEKADKGYPAYFDRFLSQVAAKESRAASKPLYKAVRAVITDKQGYKDIERVSEEGDYDARLYMAGAPEKAVQEYHRLIEERMRSFGAFSRIYLRSLR